MNLDLYVYSYVQVLTSGIGTCSLKLVKLEKLKNKDSLHKLGICKFLLYK